MQPSVPLARPPSKRRVIVLPAGLYRTVRGAIEATQPFPLPVSFFADYDAALAHAIKVCKDLKDPDTA